ncbi:MAG: hypothetical protein ACREO5_00155 [Candidatus Binatia bacterium]
MDVTFVTENPGRKYSKAVDDAKTLPALIQTLAEWKRFAEDALAIAEKMTDADFVEFRMLLAKERRGKFAGEQFSEKYGAIVMPEKLLISSLVESQYKVPWGLAFLRCEQEGWIMLKHPSTA